MRLSECQAVVNVFKRILENLKDDDYLEYDKKVL